MHALAIFGITGRMGQALLWAMRSDPRFHLCGAIASGESGRLGADAAAEGTASGVTITSDPRLGLEGAAVAVDFSLSTCVTEHAHACVEAQVPILIGTTGLDAASRNALTQAAKSIPVLIAPNTSVGAAVVAQLVAQAALKLGSAYDAEILETHHRTKRDSPSGTALALGEAIAEARAVALTEVAVYDRFGLGTRMPGSIGFASVRAGDIVGEHTVIFAAEGERVEIIHRATDRTNFARGALRAADWLVGKPAGLYSMRDVLGT